MRQKYILADYYEYEQGLKCTTESRARRKCRDCRGSAERTWRWLCNCRVGREVPRSAYFLPQYVGELKLSGGSVTTLE
jgi:hypothetical protein